MMDASRERRLYVGWRDPETERIWPVGLLVRREGQTGAVRFIFAYLELAPQLERFRPFASFPDLHAVYESPSLFPMFTNRIMPRERPDYAAHLERLDLPGEPEPFEVLQRSGGFRATDRVEVFPEPEVDPATGRLRCLFFSRGIDHIEGGSEAVSLLQVGDPLSLVDEPDNPVNPRALLLHAPSGSIVGYAPDYLVEFLHEVRELCDGDVSVRVEHVNPPETPPHLRLLCGVESCTPAGYRPFSEARFRSLSPEPFTTSLSSVNAT
jgi:hypothetical protein